MLNEPRSSYSLIDLEGEKVSNVCRYCDDKTSPKSTWCVSSNRLTVNDYKILMDCGWRRHGNQYYKTLGHKTCCPPYTIRCDAENFRISKAQKKALSIVATFLKRGEKPTEAADDRNASIMSIIKQADDSYEHNPYIYSAKYGHITDDRSQYEKPLTSCSSEDSGIYLDDKRIKVIGRSGSSKRRRWQALQEHMARKAEELGVPYEEIMQQYLERRRRRLAKNKPKEIEEFLEEETPNQNFAHTLDIRLCRCTPQSEEFKATYEQEYDLYYRYQVIVHKASPSFARREDFDEFLIESSLVNDHDEKAEAAGAPQFGSYHQQYWLDGKKLIAVGVIDIVPGCLSSVYFFYDPEYSFLHLGTYSALREIAYIRYLNRTYGSSVPALSNFTQYYMGYYIHSTPKMRYKQAFSPSYLACPETYNWVPIERCERLLDKNKYTRLADCNEKRLSSSVSKDEPRLQLSFSEDLANKLHDVNFTVEGDAIRVNLENAECLLSQKELDLVREWFTLVPDSGTMYINCKNFII
nr:arginyl tRNA protein transferase 1 [Hymenolepis microstoma]